MERACLNAPEPTPGNENGVDGGDQVESPEEPANQHLPPQGSRPGIPQNPHMPGNYMPANLPMDPQQALAYQSYVQRNQGYGSGIPPQPGMPSNNHHQS
ncbi:transcription factor of the MADS box [Fusarium falciforme]|nr:transcription factor of the MADS box [Fusarium falciforme]